MKRKLLIGSAVSAVFLFLALRDIEWAVLWEVLKRTRLLPLIPALIFTMLGHYARAYRWKLLLRPVKTIRTGSLFSATMIGYMANNLLPARLGEIVRAFVIGKVENISRSASMATIVFERLVDMSSLIVVLMITMFKVSGPDWMRKASVSIFVANLLLFAAVFLIERYREQSSRFVGRLASRLPPRAQSKVLHVTDSFVSGLGAVRDARMLVPIVLTSVIVWGSALLGMYFVLEALEMSVPAMASLALLVFASLGAMIPSAPAYLGTLQYACILALAIYGVGKSEALAYSLLYHATQFFPVTIIGFMYLGRMQLKLGDLSNTQADDSSHTP
jgi:uncharacterized protein (TIRG00374 family)